MLLRKNFASGLLASPLTTGSSTMTLAVGHTLPTTLGGFVVIVWNVTSYQSPASDPNIEIMKASYSGTPNVYNITRAQEGTSAATHQSSDKVALTITAGVTEADMLVVGTKEVDESEIADGTVLSYNVATDKVEYVPAGGAILPAQTGNAGKFLTTDGSNASWGAGGFPSGGIILWSGSIATIPTGWVLCDGSNSTPDLRDRFVMSAGGSYAVGASGDGSIPAHSHSSVMIPTSDSGSNRFGNSGTNFATSGSTGSFGTGTKNIAVYYALAYIMKV